MFQDVCIFDVFLYFCTSVVCISVFLMYVYPMTEDNRSIPSAAGTIRSTSIIGMSMTIIICSHFDYDYDEFSTAMIC